TSDGLSGSSTAGDPSGASGAAGAASGLARFPRQPLPTPQAVLWRPAVQELARPDDDPSLIFIAQHAIAAVEDHLVSAPHEALLGFLVGRVFETPETALPYVIVHGAVRVPQMIVNGASERVVAQALAAAQRMLPPEDGVVVGWYRSDPTGVLRISADDHQAHVRHFPRSWQFALLVTIRPSGARGGCFRPAGESGSPAPYLPFYELLAAAAVVGSVALGVRLGLGPPARPESPLPEPAAVAPEATAGQAVQQAITAYRQQASLFASRQGACADLARALTDVDEAWLRYTLASPPAAAGDSTTPATAQSGLAADVDQVEADFERSGCPRP